MNRSRVIRSPRLFLPALFLALVSSVSAQWVYTEDLSLFVHPDLIEGRADYRYHYGWNPWGIGGELHGLLNNDDEEEFAAIGFAGFGDPSARVRLGGGLQQRDDDTGISPVLDLRWVWGGDGISSAELYLQHETDGAGTGIGVRYRLFGEVSERVNLSVLADASWFEELDEDLDGHAAVLFEPSVRLPALNVGPSVTFHEDRIEFGLILMVAH